MRTIDANELWKIVHFSGKSTITIDEILALIDNAPTIKTFTLADIEKQYRKGLEKGLSEWETERPQGEWITNSDDYSWKNRGRHCSICHYNVEFSCNFCPNCGADMRGEEE